MHDHHQTLTQKSCYHIAQDGTGDFTTISQALEALAQMDKAPVCPSQAPAPAGTAPDLRQSGGSFRPVTLYLHPGVYRERIAITRPCLTLEGASAETVILTGGLYARMPMEDIGKRGTFRSWSVLVMAHDITFRCLTLENSAGPGPAVGQALALYADGDRLVFDRCRFLGNQDTLFTAPLPPAEIEPNGFVGPGRKLPRIQGRHYYRDCYIEGDIDFIFGGATAYFENCDLFCKDIGRPVNSYVTAPSTPEGQTYGYVFRRCRFTGNCPPHTAYLGRPWREYAKAVLLECHIGQVIAEEGWDDWNKPAAHETAFFAEYESSGPSSDLTKRPDWVKRLTAAEAAYYTKEQVLGGRDGWNP